MKFQTTCIHGDGPNDATGAVSPAIYCTSTFSHPHVGESTGFNYTRESNPTHARLEKVMSALESGVDSLAFSSGMAAIDAVMRLFVSGDHILTGFDLYGGSFRLFRSVYEPYGLTFSAVHTSDLEAVERAITPKTKAIYLETPTNPTFVISREKSIAEKLRSIYKTTGACLSVFDAWLMLRSLRTLPLRMRQHEKNAETLAAFLKTQPYVQKVLYPGLPEHPGYEIQKKQATGFGGMISFYVDTPERAKKILEGISLIQFAESLGGAESLMTYPRTQTHADLTPEEAKEKGITDTLLRFSVGLEDVEDLKEDLLSVFKNL